MQDDLAPNSSAVLLVVSDVNVGASDVLVLTLTHPAGRRLPDWTPGSHIDLVLPGGRTRQYSLCGDRWDSHSYRIAVLREKQGWGGSAYVHDQLREGDTVGVGGPRNNFNLVPSERYLFIAGGIGITPMLSMVDQAERMGADWQLEYGGRTRSSMAFLNELADYGDRVRIRPQDEIGLLNLPALLDRGPGGRKVYSCGPPSLLAAVEARCSGWPPGSLRIERFVAKQLGALVRNTPFDVELARSRTVVTVTPEMSILDAIRAAGVPVLSSCRQGICGTCETAVIRGDPDHRDSLLDDDERETSSCMFICVSRSLSPRLVLDL